MKKAPSDGDLVKHVVAGLAGASNARRGIEMSTLTSSVESLLGGKMYRRGERETLMWHMADGYCSANRIPKTVEQKRKSQSPSFRMMMFKIQRLIN